MSKDASLSKAVKPTNQAVITKKLIVDEYKKRLKDNLKSLNDNFLQILTTSKVNTDDAAHKNNSSGKMADFNTVRTEVTIRAALMVKAVDELLMLTNDIREFLILRDFNFLSHSITNAEKCVKAEIEKQETTYDAFRQSITFMINDIDKELVEHFSLRY